MLRSALLALTLFLPLVLAAAPARADGSLASTPAHPCGVAPSQPGFYPVADIPRDPSGTTVVNLIVAQDESADRLCYVYDGVAQAPTIHVRPGDHLMVRVTNNITNACEIANFFVGSICDNAAVASAATMATHNHGGTYPVTPDPMQPVFGITNLHTHGLEVSPLPGHDEVIRTNIYPDPSANSGGPTGPRSFTYEYDIPADHPTGLYWYHPHRHGEAEAQVQMGLSGAIVIEGPDDDRRRALGIADQVLIIRDTPNRDPGTGTVAFTRDNLHSAHASLPTSGPLDPRVDRADAIACPATISTSPVMDLTLNGAPVAEDGTTLPTSGIAQLTMRPGEVQLWRLLNASADSYVLPRLVQVTGSGAPQRLAMTVLARDGVPLANNQGVPQATSYGPGQPLLLSPAARAEILVTAPPQGARLYLVSEYFDTGCTGNPNPARPLLLATTSAGANVTASGLSGAGRLAAAADQQPITKWASTLGSKADAQRTLAFTEYPHSFTDPSNPEPGTTDFYITEIAGPDVNPATVKITPFDMNGPPNIVINLGPNETRTEDWTIENYTVEVHAFHIHQVHFQPLPGSIVGPGQPMLDTINVPAATVLSDGTPGVPGSVKIRLTFTPDIAGTFVYHCHILYHEDNGMMGIIQVNRS